MKIAMTARHYNKQGGISRYVAELAERFAKEHEVHVFATEWKDVGNPDVIFHKVLTVPGPLVVNSVPFTIQNTLRFRLFGARYDIIHINGGESLSQDIITAHSVHRAGMEYLKTVDKEVRGYGFHDLYALTTEKINYSRRNYKKIISDSTSAKKELMKYYGIPNEDITVIPLGVDLDEFKPLPDRDLVDLRHKYGIDDNDVVLIVVATEFYRKGLSELIKALSNLKAKSKENIKLLVVGDGKREGRRKGSEHYAAFAKNLGLESNVVFTGHVQDLNLHYNLADTFVFPTKYEAFGMPTLEAMSVGLPVLNSKIGAGELITDGKDGIHLENSNDPVEIANKLEMLIDDSSLRKKLGKNARRTAENYSWDECARRTMEVYEEVLDLC